MIFFSSEECSNRGGTNAGTCADGFGVCCTCKYLNKKYESTDETFLLFLLKLLSVAERLSLKTARTLKLAIALFKLDDVPRGFARSQTTFAR